MNWKDTNISKLEKIEVYNILTKFALFCINILNAAYGLPPTVSFTFRVDQKDLQGMKHKDNTWTNDFKDE